MLDIRLGALASISPFSFPPFLIYLFFSFPFFFLLIINTADAALDSLDRGFGDPSQQANIKLPLPQHVHLNR